MKPLTDHQQTPVWKPHIRVPMAASAASAPLILRWATHTENMRDAAKHGSMPKGEKHWNAKLSDEQVKQIRAMNGTKPQYEIAEMFNVSKACVSAIMRGTRRKSELSGV